MLAYGQFQTETHRQLGNKFLKIGHRGAMGYEPENTLGSFQTAIKLGVDMIELDVHLCKSGELVVIHNEKVDRTTNGKGFIADMTLAELKKLDAGRGQLIPTLEEVLDEVNRRVSVNIELKGIGTAMPVAGLIDKYVSGGWDRNLFLVSSFNVSELKDFREKDGKSRIGIIFDKKSGDLFGLVDKLGAYSIHPNTKLVTPDLIEEAHKKGLRVFVWTVNFPDDIRRLIKIGVDGIFSDFPDRLVWSGGF
ncbi:MAG: hypothetical protein A2655_01015 [Candidatus Yanofskybacteria bacterium RIFCSPHIGHO2_01_FULL_43_42]|uniref:GP-PDE domain-containing protein n=1 Tax=Candidatus Yanofskybacteria bacterium RIFCSPLOWO2_01_FULL_43_22 TaxID=1802695 RepID=A0A1F8GEL9_9BACT|nr:MAG: hypothetical protein A2655_01015 [Candidatus Yanofskybacteria bacterium RIFCSPHIGHO2_01_FULL_43_42]OGN12391.1 MAG: hypothetical protein A3D48_01745 [Candidatus Yanofskybacteria bacterium RIFCSPHIGHO2_02_FULL_43_17]OGN23763.1 MAG: hypothetical protein A3A13_01805 [Candidatus Yanofskybacteria bacterium RIFCSPLOWO2_01_FULL_43_22]